MNEVELGLLVEEEIGKLVFPSAEREPFWGVTITQMDARVHVRVQDTRPAQYPFEVKTLVCFSYYQASDRVVFENISLRKDLRGNKVGRALVEMVESVALKLGVSEIKLDAVQPEAERFWEHLGYGQDNDWEYRKHFKIS